MAAADTAIIVPTTAFDPAQVVHTVLPAGTITFTDSVDSGQIFFYFIHAMNPLGASPNSNIVETATLVPAVPTGLTASVALATSVTLNWTAATSASGYSVERSVDSGATFTPVGTVGNVTTFADAVTAGTAFTYRVAATNVFGSSTASVSVIVDLNAPVSPTLVATAQASGEIILTWNNVANEAGYRIERATSVDGVVGAFTQVAEVGVNVATYTDMAVQTTTEYQNRMTAFNGLGASVSNTVVIASATPAAAPAAPTDLVTALRHDCVDLSWTDASANEAGFIVERADDAGFAINLIQQTMAGNVTTASDTTVAPAATVFFHAVASNAIGSLPPSNTVTVTTPASTTATSSAGTTTTPRITTLTCTPHLCPVTRLRPGHTTCVDSAVPDRHPSCCLMPPVGASVFAGKLR